MVDESPGPESTNGFGLLAGLDSYSHSSTGAGWTSQLILVCGGAWSPMVRGPHWCQTAVLASVVFLPGSRGLSISASAIADGRLAARTPSRLRRRRSATATLQARRCRRQLVRSTSRTTTAQVGGR
jgi:hypothetical protein